MRMLLVRPMVACAAVWLPASLAVGQVSPPALRVEAMNKLERMVGEWRGSGWSSVSGARIAFAITETVTRRAGGTVLLVEGRGTKMPGVGTVTHDGLTVISYDDRSGRYRWQGHEAASGAVNAEIALLDDGIEWHIAAGATGTVRFIIRLSDQQWLEAGAVSADGRTWTTVMEMTLERVK